MKLTAKTRTKENVVIQGARVLDPAQGLDETIDVRVDSGVIAHIGRNLDTNEHHVVDARGLVLAPAFVPSLREYTSLYGITPARVRPGQVVMHPGPMNRGVEIDPRVADAPDALIETQVKAGLVVRMAVLYDLLTHGPVAVEAAVEQGVA